LSPHKKQVEKDEEGKRRFTHDRDVPWHVHFTLQTVWRDI